MGQSQSERIKELFDRLRALPLQQRDEALRAMGNSPEAETVCAEVRMLLDALDQAGPFLESPTGGGEPTALRAAPAVPELSGGIGTQIGPYKLLQLIGEGGFGNVYMAEQERPVRRRVALKIIKLGMDTKQVVARFEQERQALALMDHPHIAKVFDAGATEAGRPYFVMELVRGVPITEFCDREHLSIPERLGLFVGVCVAVQHAHQKGIIHRDLKPSNVLVTIADGRPVPKVIDFGIAKATQSRLTEKTLFTELRQLLGTPEYMSPEQAESNGVDIDTRTDVYSLGVLLYELLTGVTPFDAKRLRSAAFGELQRIIREVEPPKPSTRLSTLETLADIAARRRVEPARLGTLVRGELDWVVMRCLEKDRARRYASADDLAQDVVRYLRQEPLEAGPPGTVYRLRKFVRRNRRAVTAAAVLASAMVLGLVGTSWGALWALQERDRSRESERLAVALRQRAEAAAAAEAAERVRADKGAVEARRLAYRLAISSAVAGLESGDVDMARALLEEAPVELRGWEWDHLDWASDASTVTFATPADTDALVASRDGRHLLTRGQSGVVCMFDAVSGGLIRTFQTDPGRTLSPYSLSVDAECSRLMMTYQSDKVADIRASVWDTGTGRMLWDRAVAGTGTFGPDGSWVCVSVLGGVALLDTLTGEEIDSMRLGGAAPRSVTGDFAGARVLLVAGNPEHLIWSIDERRVVARFGSHELGIQPDEPTIVFYHASSGLHRIDLTTGDIQPIPDAQIPPAPIIDGLGYGLFCVAGPLGVLRTYALPNGEPVSRISIPQSSIAWRGGGGGRTFFTLGKSGVARAWDITVGQQPFVVETPSRGAYASAVSSSAAQTAIIGWGDVCLYDARTGENLWSSYFTRQKLYAAAFSPDGRTLAVGGSDAAVTLLDVGSGRVVGSMPMPEGAVVVSLAWSPGGDRLLAGLFDGRILGLDPRAPRASARAWAEGHGSAVVDLEFSPDGEWVVSASAGRATLRDYEGVRGPGEDHSVRLWHARTGRPEATLATADGPFRALAFSPGGASVAACSSDAIGLYSVPGGQTIARSPVRGDADALACTPDGSRLVVMCRDQMLRLYGGGDLGHIADMRVETWRAGGVVGFTPDGGALVACMAEHPVIAYETRPPSDPERRFLSSRANRLLHGLFRESGYVAELVCERIREAPDLSDGLREVAVRQALVRGDDPNRINNYVWLNLLRPGQTSAEYGTLADQAGAAARAAPGNPGILTTLGIAEHRAGSYEDAVATLLRSNELSPAEAHPRLAINWSVIAMARIGLGQHDGAAEALSHARRHNALLGVGADRDVTRFLQEAEDRTAGAPPAGGEGGG